MSNETMNSDGISKKKNVKKKFRIAIQNYVLLFPQEKKKTGKNKGIRNTLNRPNPMDRRYRNKALLPPRQKGKTTKNTDLGANSLKNQRKNLGAMVSRITEKSQKRKSQNLKYQEKTRQEKTSQNKKLRMSSKNGHTFVNRKSYSQ
eukprot:TCONS_00031786-protein